MVAERAGTGAGVGADASVGGKGVAGTVCPSGVGTRGSCSGCFSAALGGRTSSS